MEKTLDTTLRIISIIISVGMFVYLTYLLIIAITHNPLNWLFIILIILLITIDIGFIIYTFTNRFIKIEPAYYEP